MSGQREPSENISGDDGQYLEEVPDDEPRTRAETVINRLGSLYWRKSYGGQDAFTCLVRTILSQNTSDIASQPAFDSLLERFDTDSLAADIRAARAEAIAETIKPAGLYNQKTAVLQQAATRVIEEFGGQSTFDQLVKSRPPEEARSILLDFDGVGPKTADCVLLFAGGRSGVFPVDTHVHRIARRIGLAPPDADHEDVRKALEASVPPEKCGFGHTAMIQFGREYCSATSPACLDGPEACPLVPYCEQVGIDPTSGTVVDPVEEKTRAD